MRTLRAALIGTVLFLLADNLVASGTVGIYALVDRVVIQPDSQAAVGIQVWGAFAFVDGAVQSRGATPAQRGYMYFAMPASTNEEKQAILKEWADLKAVAGTGQAVAFGDYHYLGAFGDAVRIVAAVPTSTPNLVNTVEIRVHPESRSAADPVPYKTGAGIVKLSVAGSHAAVVQQLKDSLKR